MDTLRKKIILCSHVVSLTTREQSVFVKFRWAGGLLPSTYSDLINGVNNGRKGCEHPLRDKQEGV